MRFLSMLFSICLHIGIIVAVLYWPAQTLKVRLDVPVYKVKIVQVAKKAPAPAKVTKAAVQEVKKTPPPPAEPKKAPAKAVAKKPKPKAKPVSATKEKPKKAAVKKKKTEKKKAVKKKKTPQKTSKKKPKKKVKPKPTPEELLRKALASSKAAVKKDEQRKIKNLKNELAALQKAVAKDDAKKAQQGIEGTPQDGIISSIEDLYALTVMATIRPHWRYPKLATRTVLVAQVRVMISRSGEILDSKLMSSSGRPDFDASTLRAIADTQTLPTPPNPDISEITLNFNSQEQ